MEPASANVRFQSDFQGTDGDTSISDQSQYGNDPTFLGSAQISNLQAWFGSTYGRFLSGGYEIGGILGSSLNQADFFIECFFKLDDVGQNDTVFSVGGETTDQKLMDVGFSFLGRLDFRFSLDGASFLATALSLGTANGSLWYYLAVQQSAGKICVWHKTLQDPGDKQPGAIANRVLNNYDPGGTLHPSGSKLTFGVQGPALGNGNEGGLGATRVTIGEALYPTCPATIPIPLAPFVLACKPTLVFPIDNQLEFLGTAYSKDFSFYFGTPEGQKNTYSAAGLPDGLAISTKGIVSGAIAAPAVEGQVFNVTITATNTCGTVDGAFTFTVGTTIVGADNTVTLHSAS